MANIQLSLTPALEAYLVALLYRNTRTSCLSLAALCARVSHDALHRLLYERVAWSRRLWDSFACSLVREGGYLVIDDTRWQRWALKSEAVSWVWSSAAGRTVRGMQVVLLIWTDGRWKVPLGLRLWRKGGASKVTLAEQMLREAKRRGDDGRRYDVALARRAARGRRPRRALAHTPQTAPLENSE